MEQSASENSGSESSDNSSDSEIYSLSSSFAQGKRGPWQTFHHKGPAFPPPYKCLPKTVKLKYNGNPISLSLEAEEIAVFYAKHQLSIMHQHKPVVHENIFKENFFDGWREVMNSREQELIKDFTKCDFSVIVEYLDSTKTHRKNELKKEKEKNDSIYQYCTIDGQKELIKKYTVEAPGLYKSNSKKELLGKIKKRVVPEDVTINCSNDDQPKPPNGEWEAVINDNEAYWLACWRSNVTGKLKYICLDEKSHQKQLLEKQKYETARELHKHIKKIRKDYREDYTSSDDEDQQRGVALYFIDKLGFRIGNEQENILDEVVGCCTLKVENVNLCDNNKVNFNFIGKSYVKYENKVSVKNLVYEKLKTFTNNKDPDEKVFDNITTKKVNDHLQTQMPNLSAKVFRTYNASIKFETLLKTLTEKFFNSKNCYTQDNMVKVFKQANVDVAAWLNHKKTKRSTGNKEVYTKTSLSDYIDPRIVVTWCERYKVPINKV